MNFKLIHPSLEGFEDIFFPDVLSKWSSVGVMLGGVMEVMGHFLNVFVDQTGH